MNPPDDNTGAADIPQTDQESVDTSQRLTPEEGATATSEVVEDQGAKDLNEAQQESNQINPRERGDLLPGEITKPTEEGLGDKPNQPKPPVVEPLTQDQAENLQAADEATLDVTDKQPASTSFADTNQILVILHGEIGPVTDYLKRRLSDMHDESVVLETKNEDTFMRFIQSADELGDVSVIAVIEGFEPEFTWSGKTYHVYVDHTPSERVHVGLNVITLEGDDDSGKTYLASILANKHTSDKVGRELLETGEGLPFIHLYEYYAQDAFNDGLVRNVHNRNTDCVLVANGFSPTVNTTRNHIRLTLKKG